MSFARGVQLGLGLVGAGYGIYRLTRGKRDWMTRSLLTTGLSIALATAMGGRNRRLARQVTSLVSSFGANLPRFRRRLMQQMVPTAGTMGNMTINALR